MSRSPSGIVAMAAILTFGTARAEPPADPLLAPVSCLIEPAARVELSTAVAGVVDRVFVDRGDRVTAGQVLAELDSGPERAALALAEARTRNEARTRALERQAAFLAEKARKTVELAARQAVSENTALEAEVEAAIAAEDLAGAQFDRDLATLEAAEARSRLEQKTLRAPFDGIITERLLDPGAYREGQAHIMTIARIDTLRVEAFVPITYYGRIAEGQSVTIRPEAPVGGAHPATITVIDRVFDAATATLGIRMTLPNPGLALPAGLRCDIDFAAPG